ncbi:hypothetical protein SLS56_010564 [Neofusicoccum ribis]|uniref:Ankyrin repeat protein n=1 Tax=Neofusicoccum ribis TaxID=45134 RepID=A0ABR3SFJ6_9PEZI
MDDLGKPGGECNPVAYAFCSALVQGNTSLDSIARVWISQLIRSSTVAHSIASEQGLKCASSPLASEVDVFRLLRSILCAIPNCNLILDGFDEFTNIEGRRRLFLQNVKAAIAWTNTRVLIVSRDDIVDDISASFADSANQLFFNYQIQESDVKTDVERFAKEVVDKSVPSRPDNLKLELANQLAKTSGGMFLWVKMQESQLQNNESPTRPQIDIKGGSERLSDVFEESWKKIQDLDHQERERAVAMLRWTMFAFRPLTVSELADALQAEFDMGSGKDKEQSFGVDSITKDLRQLCEPLIELRDPEDHEKSRSQTIHILHSSVRDYVVSPDFHHRATLPAQISLSNISAQHCRLAEICLRFLSSEDSWNRPDCGFLDYAARSWYRHVIETKKEDVHQIPSLKQFLAPRHTACFKLWARFAEKHLNPKYDDAPEPSTPLYYANVNIQGGAFGTPLIAAAFYGREKMVSRLLDSGADSTVAIPAKLRHTALFAAVRNNHLGTFRILLDRENNAPISLPNKNNIAPLHSAALNGNLDMVKILLDLGANPSTPGLESNTPFYNAASSGHVAVAKLLFEHDPNQLNDHFFNGYTPLGAAAENGYLAVVKFLLKSGADITATNDNGMSSLYGAVMSGKRDIVELLLDHGASISVRRTGGWTPLHLAAESGQVDMITEFCRNGDKN